MRLILIRHGQTLCNVTGELDTAFPGAGLTPLGEAQAAALPAAFAGEAIAAVYASPLRRTQMTAAPLAAVRGLTVAVRAGLEEIPAGGLEMRSDPHSRDEYAQCLDSWIHGKLDRAMPDGPDGQAFLDRFDDALQTILDTHSQDNAVAVVSHGAAIRVFTALKGGIDTHTATRLQIMNTGGGIFEHHPESGWKLLSWHTEPFGGAALEDRMTLDVTGGEPVQEQNQPV